MSLDMSFCTFNDFLFHQKLEEKGLDIFEISLSRTFCNLLCRKDVISHQDELSQIGSLTNIDISPIYEMEWYCEESDMQSMLGIYDTDEEKDAFIQKTKETNAKVIGNLPRVLKTVQQLLQKLPLIEDLPNKLIKTPKDTLNIPFYFDTFEMDRGDGYIRNNFGQDLRNLYKLLEVAASIGEETVFFSYG